MLFGIWRVLGFIVRGARWSALIAVVLLYQKRQVSDPAVFVLVRVESDTATWSNRSLCSLCCRPCGSATHFTSASLVSSFDNRVSDSAVVLTDTSNERSHWLELGLRRCAHCISI